MKIGISLKVALNFGASVMAFSMAFWAISGVNEDMDLKVSAFSLGKIWFKLLNSDPDAEVLVRAREDSIHTICLLEIRCPAHNCLYSSI